MQLGLSGLEAEAYMAVLTEPESTGYRVSQILGKAAPNTYKALNSLVTKGAVIADDGGRSRTFSAIPVHELVTQMSIRLRMLGDQIEKSLENLKKPESDEGVYSLTTVHQVLARAKDMIANAKFTIVVDADPGPMRELKEDFRTAAARGVKVLLHGRTEMDIPGCEIISSCTEGWFGDMLILVVDSQQYLISFMSNGMRTLIHATWSRNFIAPCIHRGYMVKALFYRISMMIGGGDHTLDEIRKELIRLWNEWGYQDAGKEALAELLKTSAE